MSEVRQVPPVAPGPEIKRFRRIVTGHDAQGRSVILSDDMSPHVMPIMDQPNFAVTDFWKTASTPADNGAGPARIRADCRSRSRRRRTAACSASFSFRRIRIGRLRRPRWAARSPSTRPPKAAQTGGPVRHAHMHRTRSIDYAIVLSGEIWAVMDEGETKMTAGDVLIQRGTNHAWANRSNAPCVVAFVLIDAKPLD